MFSNLFLAIIDMSISATIVIVVILLLRNLLKSAPKIYSYSLWLIVLIRLLVPFSIESNLSIVPNANNIKERTVIIQNSEMENSTPINIVEESIVNSTSNGESVVNQSLTGVEGGRSGVGRLLN